MILCNVVRCVRNNSGNPIICKMDNRQIFRVGFLCVFLQKNKRLKCWRDRVKSTVVSGKKVTRRDELHFIPTAKNT